MIRVPSTPGSNSIPPFWLDASGPLRSHAHYESRPGSGRFWSFLGVRGGVEEDRTPDLRIANATLSQLSYHPMEAPDFTANGAHNVP
jgi:hypothetical protein